MVKYTPIAYTSSPYKQKFAIPRQPNLVREAMGEIRFVPEFSDVNALRGIEAFSHLWLLFHFHECAGQGSSATVSPPRLGGQQRVGVFASRSMFRPNPIGLSVVENAGLEQRGSSLVLKVRGLDLLDGTPILDIKPYLPYADAVPGASGGYAPLAPETCLQVEFSEVANTQVAALETVHPGLAAFITAVLQQDPRPAQHARSESDKVFAMLLHDVNVRWQVYEDRCKIIDLERVEGHAWLQGKGAG
jgi:tRNA (adenine37-N6)-methyltransferase